MFYNAILCVKVQHFVCFLSLFAFYVLPCDLSITLLIYIHTYHAMATAMKKPLSFPCNIYTCVYTRLFACIFTCMFTCIFLYIHVCLHVCLHIFTRTHTHTHTHIHSPAIFCLDNTKNIPPSFFCQFCAMNQTQNQTPSWSFRGKYSFSLSCLVCI